MADTKKPMTVETASTSVEEETLTEPTEEERPPDPKDYVPPAVTLTEDDLLFLQMRVRSADEAQSMFLEGKLDEEGLAKAVQKYGKPSNPSEEFNRVDATYDTKLPKWVFNPPEGSGLTMEEKIKEAQAHTPDAGPLTHEQLVTLPPEAQKEAAAKMKKEAEKAEKAEKE